MTGVSLVTLNEAKTEAILFTIPNHRVPKPRLLPIDICQCNVITSANIHDFGVHLDSTLSMTAHVSRTCRTAYAQLHCIAQIRSSLKHRACKTHLHARVAPRLVFGKAAIYGITGTLLHRLEMSSDQLHESSDVCIAVTDTARRRHYENCTDCL